AMIGFVGSFDRASKTVRENFALARGAVAFQRLKDHVVALLRIRSAIPGTVECDEYAISIARWELPLVIANHRVRSPMRGKSRRWWELVRALTRFLSTIGPVLRGEHQLLLKRVVVAERPAVVPSLFQQHHFFGRQRGFLLGFVELGPICVELVTAVLRDENPAGRINAEARTMPNTGSHPSLGMHH